MLLRALLIAGSTVLFLTGCTEDAMPGAIEDATACESAVNEVAEATDGRAAPEDLAPAFDACTSVEDFSQFAEQEFAEMMGDMDAEEFVADQCNAAEALADTQLCESL